MISDIKPFKIIDNLYFVGSYRASCHMISTSEIRVSVLIDRKDAENAVKAIHSKFELNN